jgi:GntR family transcriptional regulator
MIVRRMSRSEEVERALLDRLESLADPSGRLPSETEIAEMFGVSRGTVRSAVGALATRGLVVRRQGMGTFLNRTAHLHNPIDQAIDFCEVIARNGRQPGRRFIKTAIECPVPEARSALELSDEPALVRHTIFTADGNPVIYCINTLSLSVVPHPLAERIVADPAISEPLYDFLERECGQRLEYHTSTIWPALGSDCDMLEPVCHPLSPVLVIDEVGFTLAARPILFSREVYPDAFMRFEMIRRRGRTVERV